MTVSMNKSRKLTALLIIAVILAVFPALVRAQETEEDGPEGMYIDQPRVFYGGLVAGANLTQVDGDYYAGYDKVGLNAGGIVYAQIKKHLAFSMEILYSEKGSKSTGPQPSPANASILVTKYGINVNYAEVPVMINYFDKRKSHFGVGVSYSRLVNSHETLDIDSFTTSRTIDLNNQYPFKPNGFDFLAGVDLHLVAGLFLNIRFQYSIVPIRTQLPPPDYARADQYNNLWVVRLMYLLK
jgi:hypothetical protein